MKEEFSFIKESIKDKPFYKKKWVKIVGATIGLAVLFGRISSFVFVKIQNHMQEKQVQDAMKEIEIPKDQPEDMTTPEESEEAEDEEPETVFVEAELTLKEYKDLYLQMQTIADKASKSLVTVTALNNDVDWFNEAYENLGQSTGMIIGDNGV